MKKFIMCALIGVLLASAAPVTFAGEGRGGAMGFVTGCLFGIRAGGDYNEGKEVHWREWIRLLSVPAIWDGIEGAQGVTTSELADRYGSMYY